MQPDGRRVRCVRCRNGLAGRAEPCRQADGGRRGAWPGSRVARRAGGSRCRSRPAQYQAKLEASWEEFAIRQAEDGDSYVPPAESPEPEPEPATEETGAAHRSRCAADRAGRSRRGSATDRSRRRATSDRARRGHRDLCRPQGKEQCPEPVLAVAAVTLAKRRAGLADCRCASGRLARRVRSRHAADGFVLLDAGPERESARHGV